MPGFLDMLINRGFANSGRSYNDMLGRYGNQLPPTPGPNAMPNNMGDGFLDQLMQQPMGLSPAEAQASEVRAPQPQTGFIDRLQSGVEDNRGMLMGLGSGLLSRGWAGVGDAMPGMEYDENRRVMEEQRAQMGAQRAAQMRLAEQYGVDPLMFEAGMGDFALQQALAPAEPPEMTSRMRELAAAGIDFTSPEGREALLRGSGVNVNVGGSEVGTIPQGFELITDPETGARQLRPIPGGPEDPANNQQQALESSLYSMDLIDSVLNNPELDNVTGVIQGRLPAMSQAGQDLLTRIEQLQGQAFMQAFETLKGGGQITEREGQAATAAIARLQRAQSGSAYREALRELRSIFERAALRASSGSIGQQQGNGMQPPPDDVQVPQTGAPRQVLNFDAQGNFIQ